MDASPVSAASSAAAAGHLAAAVAAVERALVRIPVLNRRADALAGLIREAGSFGVIGLVLAVVDAAIFTVLSAGFGIGPLTAKAISSAITIVLSYYANRRWTWPHRPGHQRRRQLLEFGMVSAGGFLIAEMCLAFSHYVLGLQGLLANNISANVIGLGLGTIWRFTACRRWVFTAPTTEAQGARKDRLRASTTEPIADASLIPWPCDPADVVAKWMSDAEPIDKAMLRKERSGQERVNTAGAR